MDGPPRLRLAAATSSLADLLERVFSGGIRIGCVRHLDFSAPGTRIRLLGGLRSARRRLVASARRRPRRARLTL